MLTKMLGPRRVFASVVSRKYPPVNCVYQTRGRKLAGAIQILVTPVRSSSHRCDAHMNELPVPCGPWEPWYSDKQSNYNKILLGGILWFLFSFGMMIYTDSIFLNWGPPKNPGPPSDMVEECEDE